MQISPRVPHSVKVNRPATSIFCATCKKETKQKGSTYKRVGNLRRYTCAACQK